MSSASREGGKMIEETIKQLLPSPRANDGLRMSPRFSGPGWRPYLEQEALRPLPTPAATDYGSNQSPSEGAAVRESLPRLVKLLPTPVEGDCRNSRSATAPARDESSGFTPGTTLSDVAYEWSGASTSPPSDDGKPSTGLRLSPWFVEWMIGAPCGWSDPDCPLSATEFNGSSASSWGDT